MAKHFTLIFLLLWSCASLGATQTQFIVAQDGTGDFKTIQAAIDAMKAFPPQRLTIFIKKGVYKEKVLVPEWNTQLSLTGESADNTIIEYGDYFEKINRGRNSTFFTPTVQVDADDFIAKNLTISNTAGEVGQAIALTVNANRALFDNVKLLGFQDTLYVTGQGNKMLFTNCYIEGSTDFIFGGASAVFKKCQIHAKKSKSYITAASTPQGEPFGLVFLNSRLTSAQGVKGVYLGRPWREHAQTVFINNFLGDHIAAAGWHNWNKKIAEKLAFYGEYGSAGPGANAKSRVTWAKPLNKKEAGIYTLEALLASEVRPAWYQQ